MSASDDDPVIPTGGTAVIVVAGVGDDQPGDTVRSMTGAMLGALGPGASSTEVRRRIVVPPGPGEESHTTHDVHAARVEGPGVGEPVVVYEMHWGDLSRFASGPLRFLVTLYGLLFQVGTVGLEAFRQMGTRPIDRFLLRVFSYLTVVVVVALIAAAMLLGVEFALLLRLDSPAADLVVGAATAAIAVGLALLGGHHFHRWGWRFSEARRLGRPVWFFLAVAAGVGAGPLLFRWFGEDTDGQALGVHETLWLIVRWVQPVAWALVGIVATGVVITLIASAWRGGPRFAALRTAAISVVVGGLGIAVLGALLVAVVLGVVSRVVDPDTTLVPFAAADEVGSVDCTFGSYATAVFGTSLEPLGLVLPCAVGLLLAAGVAGFPYVAGLSQRDGAAREPVGGWLPISVTVATGIAVAGLLFADRDGTDALALALAVVPSGWRRGGPPRPSVAARPATRCATASTGSSPTWAAASTSSCSAPRFSSRRWLSSSRCRSAGAPGRTSATGGAVSSSRSRAWRAAPRPRRPPARCWWPRSPCSPRSGPAGCPSSPRASMSRTTWRPTCA